jgi:hypothetical protein
LLGPLLGILLILFPGNLRAEAAPEYEVKAAFLCKFADFIEWPAENFPTPDSSFVIGILGKDPSNSTLEKLLANERIQNRSVLIRRLAFDGDVSGCHLVFIGSASRRQYGPLIKRIARSGLLTVGDGEGFCAAGGLIGFYHADTRIRFEINLARSRRANLKISSRLLALARVVEEPMPVP